MAASAHPRGCAGAGVASGGEGLKQIIMRMKPAERRQISEKKSIRLERNDIGGDSTTRCRLSSPS